MIKHCPRCLEPLGDKALVATVNEQELCAVCGAAVIGKDVGVDVDLAQGLMATILGQARGSAFIASYVQRQAVKATGEKSQPPIDPLAAQMIGLAPSIAKAIAALKKTTKKQPKQKKRR